MVMNGLAETYMMAHAYEPALAAKHAVHMILSQQEVKRIVIGICFFRKR